MFFDSRIRAWRFSSPDDIKVSIMSKSSHVMDDIAQLAGGAAGLLGNLQQQIRDDIKARVEEVATRMDLVPREEFERVEGLLAKALEEQAELKKRIEALEKKK
jgi:BMFP domain-containing protein YqiC